METGASPKLKVILLLSLTHTSNRGGEGSDTKLLVIVKSEITYFFFFLEWRYC